MKKFARDHPSIRTDVWVDDISFDIIEDTPKAAAKEALAGIRDLKKYLEEDGLLLSVEKTGIIVSHRNVKEEVNLLRQEGDPKVVDAMRDLGCDSAGGRLRRIATLKSRQKKAAKKSFKLEQLKIPKQAVKVRLCKGSIQASTLWGIEGTGLPPQRRQQARVALGRCLGLKLKGNLDILYDIRQEHADPGDIAMEKQLKVFHHIVMNWPEEMMSHVASAWKATKQRMDQAVHMWKVVRGPMAAMQAYLEEGQWQYEELTKWWKPGNDLGPAMELNLEDSWPYIQQTLHEDFRRRRIQRLQKLSDCGNIHNGLDWKIHKQMTKKGSFKEENALLLWHQGALQTHAEGQHKLCPLCHERADATHLIWQCKWIKKKAGNIDPTWEEAIRDGQEKELWARGLVQLPTPTHHCGAASIVTHGTWMDGSPHPISPGHKVMINVQATSNDKRLKHYIVGVVHYDDHNQRQGIILATPPGAQTPRRAWFYGLMLVHHFVPGPIVIQVPNRKTQEAWYNPHKRKGVQDLGQDLNQESHKRITVVVIRKVHLTEPQHQSVRDRMKDAHLAVKERVDELRPKATEAFLKEQDVHIEKIYKEAAKRVQLLLEDRSHFFHSKEEKAQDKRVKMRWKKKDFFNQLPSFAPEQGHKWVADKVAYKCQKCSTRVTVQTPFEQLKRVAEETCTEEQPSAGGATVGGKKPTRDEVLKDIVQRPWQEGQHEWQVHGHYLKCMQCGAHCLKRCNQAELQRTLEQVCYNGPYIPDEWQGHPTHQLWRRGASLACEKCQAKAKKQQGKFIETTKLLAACPTSSEKKVTLQTFFAKTPSH